jgi:hypothetical protein
MNTIGIVSKSDLKDLGQPVYRFLAGVLIAHSLDTAALFP